MKTLEQKHLETVSASIVTNQLALHYQEELAKLNSNFYKHSLKKYGKLYQKELIKAEEKEFDKVFDTEPDTTHKVFSNLQEGVEFIAKRGFGDMMFHMKAEMVFQENPERSEKFVDKLIKEYNIVSK